jgi:predicted PurR-regulated permease PerM
MALLPGGSAVISLFAAGWLLLEGREGAALGLALWALLIVASMDNLLRPILISERGRISFLLVFLGVLGGLAAFGLVGLFIGPVLLSVSFTLLNEFSRMPVPGAAPASPAPADDAQDPAPE